MRLTTKISVTIVLLLLAGVAATLRATQASPAPGTHTIVPADRVSFAPIEIPGFASGVKLAAVYGDPNAASGEYVVRLRFPAGYKFPAHWHPNAENLTVLSGEFLLGMGDKEEAGKLVSYKPGTFMYIPGKMAHFGGAKAATEIQLHGQAPFKIELATAPAK